MSAPVPRHSRSGTEARSARPFGVPGKESRERRVFRPVQPAVGPSNDATADGAGAGRCCRRGGRRDGGAFATRHGADRAARNTDTHRTAAHTDPDAASRTHRLRNAASLSHAAAGHFDAHATAAHTDPCRVRDGRLEHNVPRRLRSRVCLLLSQLLGREYLVVLRWRSLPDLQRLFVHRESMLPG